jgi:DNA-binding CsgD family transcriptional regulator
MTSLGLQETLDELGANVQDALEELTLPAGILDVSGTLLWANTAARELLGDAPVGRSFFGLVDAADVRAVREDHVRIVLGSGSATDRTVMLLVPDGGSFRAELSGVRLKSGEEIVGVFGIARLQPVETGAEQPSARLTPRQTQVLRLLASGRSTEQIAAELGIAVDTTRNHVRGLLRRLDSHSRIEAVVRAHALGLLEQGVPSPRRAPSRRAQTSPD